MAGAVKAQSRGLIWTVSLMPVQEWITAARRSRDLLAGSSTLSWMMLHVLWELRQCDAEVLVPDIAPHEPPEFSKAMAPWRYAIPNRATGTASLSSRERLIETLERVSDSSQSARGLSAWWSELIETAIRSSGKATPSCVVDLLPGASCPFHLAYAVLEGEVSDRKGLLEAADRALTAVKRSRSVTSHQGAPVRKCGQCGRREAIGPPIWREWVDYRKKVDTLREIALGLRFDRAELLCGVCSTKRLLGYSALESFPSTAEVAASDWLARASTRSTVKNLRKEHERVCRETPGFSDSYSDTAPLLYQRTIDTLSRAAQRDGDRARVEALRRVGTSLNALKKKAGEQPRLDGLANGPSEYLAVLQFDGDFMGSRVKAEADLPERLITFAQDLGVTLTLSPSASGSPESLAQPFYLGGDEGLLLAPLSAVLPLAFLLRQRWRELVNQTAEGTQEPNKGLSVGAALFDRNRPLGASLDAARSTLDEAKQLRREKDALAITVATASGNRWTARGAWESWSWTLPAAQAIANDSLSSSWPYDLGRMLRELPVHELCDSAEGWEAVRTEARRLTFRRVQALTGEERAAKGEALWKALRTGGFLAGEGLTERTGVELQELPRQLHLLAFLAGKATPEPITQAEACA